MSAKGDLAALQLDYMRRALGIVIEGVDPHDPDRSIGDLLDSVVFRRRAEALES